MQNQSIDNTFANNIANPERSYLWQCSLNGESKDCRATVPLCDGQEYDPAVQQCCTADGDGVNNHEGVF